MMRNKWIIRETRPQKQVLDEWGDEYTDTSDIVIPHIYTEILVDCVAGEMERIEEKMTTAYQERDIPTYDDCRANMAGLQQLIKLIRKIK